MTPIPTTRRRLMREAINLYFGDKRQFASRKSWFALHRPAVYAIFLALDAAHQAGIREGMLLRVSEEVVRQAQPVGIMTQEQARRVELADGVYGQCHSCGEPEHHQHDAECPVLTLRLAIAASNQERPAKPMPPPDVFVSDCNGRVAYPGRYYRGEVT